MDCWLLDKNEWSEFQKKIDVQFSSLLLGSQSEAGRVGVEGDKGGRGRIGRLEI
jgi:hypothetical protein